MAPGPAGDGAEAGPLTSATPALPGRSPKPRISYSIEYATTRLRTCENNGERISTFPKVLKCPRTRNHTSFMKTFKELIED